MKKLVAILLILSCLLVFASCGKEPVDDGKALETAETYIEVTGNAGAISIDENVAQTLLEIYPKESLGLSKDIYDYELKLSATRFSDNDACLVEAFQEGQETPEGTFIIYGQRCFVYDKKTEGYLLLTVDGAVETTSSHDTQAEVEPSDTKPAFVYDEDNNKKLQERFASYGKKKLGLEKEISEYILVASGTTTTVENGDKVFVIRVYEKSGEVTNFTVAFNQNGNYFFDYDINKYVKL